MTLVKTKPKVKPASERKRAGLHHRHSQHYVKTYWPYLPLIAIFGLGLVANSYLSSSPTTLAKLNLNQTGLYGAKLAATSGFNWPLWSVVFVTLAVICWFLSRHLRLLKSALSSSEKLVVDHYAIDVIAAFVIVVGLLISRASGLI